MIIMGIILPQVDKADNLLLHQGGKPVHDGHNDQGQEGGKGQSEYHSPGHGPPEYHLWPAKIEIGCKTGKQSLEVNIQTQCQGK